MTSAAAGLSPRRNVEKILRACVVQGGKVVDEQRLRRRVPLTIGNTGKNTFVIDAPGMPRGHELFAVHGGEYELVVTESMRGKISVGDQVADIAVLKAQGLMKKRGDFYCLPLTDDHRGKVVIGDVTLIFQFVIAPPEPAQPQLPAAARGSLVKSIDWPFAVALAVILCVEFPIVVAVHFVPPQDEVTLETLDDRWAKLIAPEYKPEVKKPQEKTADNEGGGMKRQAAKQTGPKDEESKAKAAAARRGELRNKIAGRGVLAVIGTLGQPGSSGAVADVFGEGGLGGDLDSAFQGISGVGLATGSERTTRGGSMGEAASIGGLATSGGGKVGLGGKQEARVASVEVATPEVDGAGDSEAIAKVVRSRIRMVQDCYQRELKRNPGLAGKIEIEITIGETGAVTQARVASNGMGSDAVGACIVSRIQSWHFPKPDGGSVTVSFPFIFTAAG